jgi:alpha-tubulin suppressor-like RCC1 family protein
MWVWGQNGNGQLGLGNTTGYSSPKQVGALTTWSKITAGATYSMAIKTDGTIWAIGGFGGYGQLGLGNTSNISSPVQIGALTTWLNIAAGYGQCAAVRTDGTLWSWGKNNDGELGDGTTTNRSSPTQIGALTAWLNVAAGGYHITAIG